MKKLIIFVGIAGTGKTTIAEVLQERYNMKVLKTYTTRPRRPNESDVNHIFVTDVNTTKDKDKLLRLNLHGYEYWTTREMLLDADIAVVDRTGATEIKALLRDRCIIVRLKAHLGDLISRITKRNGLSEDQALEILTAEHNKYGNALLDYDLKLDTSELTIDEVVDIVMEEYES